MLDKRAGAVNSGAFLVTRDDQADRTSPGRDVMQRRDKSRDAALHIDCAAPMEQVAAHFGHERIALPAVARRHHIDMTGKGEMAPSCRADGKEILDRRAMRRIVVIFTCNESFDGKTERQQHRFECIEHRTAGRRNALASDQFFGIAEGKAVGHRTAALRTYSFRNKSDGGFAQCLFG